ncbi:hypothetical protein E1B28_011220 [Marasmius oreades]|uniref:Putative gamma-glutamylcyclotransferase n=1 Tax=Marasmius oreades TaxID=181124 RepID=A0A9P7RTU3_9AGAR|nr:uncharacterized protein E1B28_011220 [Marasmius oreades]KAG7089547.1 hypothetical protein E1B28_011220 [Marasmius oreades]
MSNKTYSALFYGTLMHPRVLHRVIGVDGKQLQIAPAVLSDFTRHKVKQEEYPGIIPYQTARSAELVPELSRDEKCVRGCLVTGLTERDIMFLDVFEGSEYRRTTVKVYPLEPLLDMTVYSKKDDESLVPSSPPPIPTELGDPIEAETYIYLEPSRLEPELWSFEEFVEQNARKWYGTDARAREDLVEVDRLRAEILALARA